MNLPDDFLSAQQVADHFGVAEKTVRRWIDAGKLPAGRRGHAFAIRLTDAERVFMDSRASRPLKQDRDLTVALRMTEDQLAELRGRYAELQALVARLESELTNERRRVARFEVKLNREAA